MGKHGQHTGEEQVTVGDHGQVWASVGKSGQHTGEEQVTVGNHGQQPVMYN